MGSAAVELPYAFACSECYGTVPLLTIAEGVRICCAECGHRQVITREWVESLQSVQGARPRALLEGLQPVRCGDVGFSGRIPLSSSSGGSSKPSTMSSGSMPLANPGSSSMGSRRAAMSRTGSSSQHDAASDTSSSAVANSKPSDAYDSLSDTPAPESSASTSRSTTRLVRAVSEEAESGLAYYGAGVPTFNDALDTAAPADALPASESGASYRGPFSPAATKSPNRRVALPSAEKLASIEKSGRRLAIVSVAPYAASVAVLMIILLLAIETLPPMMLGSLDTVLTLPAFTLLAAFAAGLLFAAGTIQGAWRGVALAGIGMLPMLFVVPALISAPGIVMVLLLTLPLVIAICYGAIAAAAIFASAPLIKIVAAVSGFIVFGVQISIALGERGMLQLPGTGDGSPVLFVLAMFMGIGPLLAIINLASPDEARARWGVWAHWVGYVGIPGLLIFVLTFNFLTTMEMLIVLLFMFGWVFAAGAGIRDVLVYLELRQRGYFSRNLADGQAGSVFRPSAVIGATSSGRISGPGHFGSRSDVDEDESGDPDESHGPAPLPEIPDEGVNLFSPVPESTDEESDDDLNIFEPAPEMKPSDDADGTDTEAADNNNDNDNNRDVTRVRKRNP